MLRHDLVDEVNVVVGPYLTGGTRTPTLFDCPDLRPEQRPTRLHLLGVQVQGDGHLWLRYTVSRG